MAKFYLLFGAFAGLMSVILGAFAAHGLKEKISASLLSTFQTGVQYQMYHALVLLLVGYAIKSQPSFLLVSSGALFVAGVLLFSGSLYLLALGGPRWLGPITPLGGLCFIGGWIALLITAAKS